MENNEEELKQQKEAEAGKKTAHVAGKAAATYFGGGVGSKIYDMASKTGAGQKIEQAVGNQLNRNPLMNKASQKLNDSGALDVADKALDLAGGPEQAAGNTVGNSNLPNTGSMPAGQGLPNTSGLPKTGGLDSPSSNNTENNNQSSPLDGNSTIDSMTNPMSMMFPGGKKKMIYILIPVISFFFAILVIIIIAASTIMPLMNAINYVKGLWDQVVDFFTEDEAELEEKYYKELENVQKNTAGVCIDINLITASLTVNRSFDEIIDDGKENDEIADDETIDSEGNPQELHYDKMTRQIKLLANMQTINAHYELDSSGNYCSSVEEIIPITTGDKDSSTPELIAKHDFKMVIIDWFTSKTTEEQNNAYYIYKPKPDSDGSCSQSYASGMLPKNGKVLSIGDYDTRKENVYYWNLVNSFIPDYYAEYIPKEEPARTEKIYQIADEIYLLYEQIGPGQTCGMAYSGPTTLCPNGITVEGEGTFDLEEYVAGVVSREAYSNKGIEALKAQAVASRTYALMYTNYCSKTIPNSPNTQTFTKNINDNAKKAAIQTAGEVLIDEEGKIFEVLYDSFCYDDEDCPDAKQNEDGTYSVTYTKLPGKEKHTITLSDPNQYGHITHGMGHANGMSQLYSYQLASEGKTYEEILKFFYSDGIEISRVSAPISTDGASIIAGSIGSYLESSNSSIDEMNSYIFSNVRKAGLGTREGVVAAATSLVYGIYSQTGYKLPYELRASGKYSGYGIDPIWGTNTNRSDYPLHGLDCSGFISWAIHNGGYGYVVKNAKSWGIAGNSRSWSKGKTDSYAQPGDLIYNAPASENGTSGHIRMIIGVTDSEYIVAEASSGKNGVRIKNISFTSTGNYYLVDMTNYYKNASKVSNYPS